MSGRDKIIHMANQIAAFMASKPEAEGVATLAQHINDFWEPRMRRQFFDLYEADPALFSPLFVKAAPLIRRPPGDDGPRAGAGHADVQPGGHS